LTAQTNETNYLEFSVLFEYVNIHDE